jgi:hypothetical protein
LKKSTLRIEYAEPLPALQAGPLPLPIDMERRREVLSVRRSEGK